MENNARIAPVSEHAYPPPARRVALLGSALSRAPTKVGVIDKPCRLASARLRPRDYARFRFFSVFLFALFFAVALPAQAATITFSPVEVSVVAGEQISIVISADAGDEKIVTVKAALSYPADVLEPVSFSFALNIIPLSQPGYDQMKDGMVIKTAGFPGGFTGTREFGTLVLRAKQTGAAIVSVSNESLLLNTQSANRFADARSLAVTIAAPAPAAPLIEKTQEAKLVPEIGAAGAVSAEAASSNATTSEQSAAVGILNNQPLRPVLILTILVIAALGGLLWRMYKRS